MKSATRTKKLAFDGAEFIIAPLTIDQIEEYIAPLDDLARNSQGRIRAYDLICTGLNNALPEGAPESDRWTHKRITAELDLVSVERLQDEIIQFSGFGIDRDAAANFTPQPNGEAAMRIPGESSAASGAGTSRPLAEVRAN